MIDLSYKGTPAGLIEYIANEICEYCHGTGYECFLESDGEGHLADTGMRPCRERHD